MMFAFYSDSLIKIMNLWFQNFQLYLIYIYLYQHFIKLFLVILKYNFHFFTEIAVIITFLILSLYDIYVEFFFSDI